MCPFRVRLHAQRVQEEAPEQETLSVQISVTK